MSVSQNTPKAQRPREILRQCRHALDELRDDPRVTWFVLWAGTLGLLRTVGDALEKDVDPRIRKAQSRWFKKMRDDNAAAGRGTKIPRDGDDWEPAIFWQFIRRDRNLLLHDAVVTASQSAILQIQGVAARAIAAGEAPRTPPHSPPPPRAT